MSKLPEGRTTNITSPECMKKKLFGVYVPLITPLSADGEQINESELRALCRFLLQKHVHGFFPVGTTGECAFLTIEERKRIAEVVVEETAGAIPVIIHTGTPTTRESIELTQHAREIGADAAAVVVPYYFSLDAQEIFAHYEAILKAVPNFPLLAYNIPHNAKNYATPAIIQALRQKYPALIGVKNSISSLTDFQEFVAIGDENFYPFIGNDRMIVPALVAGACGSVSANALLFPELFVELFDHYYAQRLPEAQIAQKKINHFMRVLGQEPSIAQLKSGLELYGLHSGGVRRPFRNLSESEKTTLLQLLRQLTQEFTRG